MPIGPKSAHQIAHPGPAHNLEAIMGSVSPTVRPKQVFMAAKSLHHSDSLSNPNPNQSFSHTLAEQCCKWRIRVFTVFTFSCDNWIQPKLKQMLKNQIGAGVEVDFLMSLFERVMESELDNFVRGK